MNSKKNDERIDKLKLAINTKVVIFKQGALENLADFIIRMIRVRTRLGYGVEENEGSKKKLKSIKETTIEERKRLLKRGELSSETTPSRSNLTRTGELLESITYKISKINFLTILIPNRKHKDSSATNAEIARYQEESGRTFFKLSSSEINQIKKECVKQIKKNNLTKFKL